MPADNWFCSKIEEMNLHLHQGHISRTGDRNWPVYQISLPKILQFLVQENRLNGLLKFLHLTVSSPGSLRHSIISPQFLDLSHRDHEEMGKELKRATMIVNQAVTFNRYVKKVHDDKQEHIKTLYADTVSKGKSSE